MKSALFSSLLLATGGLASRLAPRQAACNANNCLRAIRATPSIALPFCTSVLGLLTTETRTVTATETYQTVTTTVTTDVSVVTETLYSFVQVDLRKRDAAASSKAAKATANIISKCDNDPSKLSSGCSCYLGVAATSTSTVTESVQAFTTVTKVLVETQTSASVTTTYTVKACQQTQLTNALPNPNFTSGLPGWSIFFEPQLDGWGYSPLNPGIKLRWNNQITEPGRAVFSTTISGLVPGRKYRYYVEIWHGVGLNTALATFSLAVLPDVVTPVPVQLGVFDAPGITYLSPPITYTGTVPDSIFRFILAVAKNKEGAIRRDDFIINNFKVIDTGC